MLTRQRVRRAAGRGISRLGEILLQRNDFAIPPWERFRLVLLPHLAHTTCPLLGRRFELTDPYWFRWTHREIMLEEIYRFQASGSNPTIIDCGANIGLSVLYFKHLYPDARVIAFEPDPGIFQVLQRNVVTYGLTKLELHQEAVWKSEGELLFETDGSVGGHIASQEQGQSRIPVRTVRLRDFLADPIDMLKIDIEGAEVEVLQDCEEALAKVAHAFVEYHGAAGEPQRFHEMLAILSRAGFRYHVKEANPVKHPFLASERGTGYDLQLNIFAFRPQGGGQ